MAYKLTSQANGYFTFSDGATDRDLQRGHIQVVYDGSNVTIYDKLAPAYTPLINNIAVTSILNGDNSDAPFANLAAFKTWWRANTPQLVSISGGGGGGGGIASTYPKYTSGWIRTIGITNSAGTDGPTIACNSVVVHNYSGGIITIYRKTDSGNGLLLQDESRYFFSGIANANEFSFQSSVAAYNLQLECITV